MGDKIKKSCKDRDSITFDFLILLIIIIKKEIRDLCLFGDNSQLRKIGYEDDRSCLKKMIRFEGLP